MINVFGFKIAIQSIKNYKKATIIFSVLFISMAALYAGLFPSFEESLVEMMDSGFAQNFKFLPHMDQMYTYVGFLTLELYNIFWLLILAIMFGFIAASTISQEIEDKTIDILMSNPVSRKQIVVEKFMGLIPMVLVVNFATMLSIIGITFIINENLNIGNLLLVHIVSIPYFLVVISLGLLISVIIDEKMKSSIVMISILVGMFVLNSLSLTVQDYKWIGSFSFAHYFDTYSVLQFSEIDATGILIFIVMIVVFLVTAMLYFENRDITIS